MKKQWKKEDFDNNWVHLENEEQYNKITSWLKSLGLKLYGNYNYRNDGNKYNNLYIGQGVFMMLNHSNKNYQELKYSDLGIEEEENTIDKWCIRITDENKKEVSSYFDRMVNGDVYRTIRIGRYLKSHNSQGIPISKEGHKNLSYMADNPEGKEVDFQWFKTNILKEKPMKEEKWKIGNYIVFKQQYGDSRKGDIDKIVNYTSNHLNLEKEGITGKYDDYIKEFTSKEEAVKYSNELLGIKTEEKAFKHPFTGNIAIPINNEEEYNSLKQWAESKGYVKCNDRYNSGARWFILYTSLDYNVIENSLSPANIVKSLQDLVPYGYIIPQKKEEDWVPRAGDYAIMEQAGGWGYHSDNNGCLALIKEVKASIEGGIDSYRVSGEILNPKTTGSINFREVPIRHGKYPGRVIVRKALPHEIPVKNTEEEKVEYVKFLGNWFNGKATVGKIYKFPYITLDTGDQLDLNGNFFQWKGIFEKSTKAEFDQQNGCIMYKEPLNTYNTTGVDPYKSIEVGNQYKVGYGMKEAGNIIEIIGFAGVQYHYKTIKGFTFGDNKFQYNTPFSRSLELIKKATDYNNTENKKVDGPLPKNKAITITLLNFEEDGLLDTSVNYVKSSKKELILEENH